MPGTFSGPSASTNHCSATRSNAITPSAQMPGAHTFEYAAYFHEGDWRAARVCAEAQSFCLPPLPVQTFPGRAGTSTLPAEVSFVRIESAECVLSALKRSEDGRALVLRFTSVSDGAQEATVHFWRPFARIARTDLAEAADETVAVDADDMTLTVGPHEIVTLRLTP